MKRTLILLLTILLTRMFCFSKTTLNQTENDSIVCVSIQDIKYANLIFAEHNKLMKDNILLSQQIENYKTLTNTLVQVDSLRIEQLNEYSILNQNYQERIEDLNKQIKKKNKTLLIWQIGGITVSTSLLLFLLFK